MCKLFQNRVLYWYVLLHVFDLGPSGFAVLIWLGIQAFPEWKTISPLKKKKNTYFVHSLEHLPHNTNHSYW